MHHTSDNIDRLEQQVNELLMLCKRLGEDNRALRVQLQHLNTERATLIEQKEQVRAQVDAMITRLRSMENA